MLEKWSGVPGHVSVPNLDLQMLTCAVTTRLVFFFFLLWMYSGDSRHLALFGGEVYLFSPLSPCLKL